jgi:hypothetical protein
MVQTYLKKLGRFDELYDPKLSWDKNFRDIVKFRVGKNPFHVAEAYVDDMVAEALDKTFTKETLNAFKARSENVPDDFRKYIGACFGKKLLSELESWTTYQSKFCRQRLTDHTNDDFTQEEVLDMMSHLSGAGMCFDESGDLVDDEGHAVSQIEYHQLVDHIRDRLERSTGKKYIVEMFDLIIEQDDGTPAYLMDKLGISKQAVSSYKEELYNVISAYAKETKNELLMILLVRMKRKLTASVNTAGSKSRSAKDGGWSSLFKIYQNFKKGHVAELEQNFETEMASIEAKNKKATREMQTMRVDLLPDLGTADTQLYFLKDGGDVRTSDDLIQNVLGLNTKLSQYEDVLVGDNGVLVGVKKAQARRKRQY